MVRLLQMLLKILRSARDLLLEFGHAPTEAPGELLNSGIGVLTREDERIHNPACLERNCNRSDSTQQLQMDECNAELSPTSAKKDDFQGMNHCVGGQSEKDKKEIYGSKGVNIKLLGILSKLPVSQDYALLARQVRQELEETPSVDILQSLVSLILENAVLHPTQCAKLCIVLGKLELPEFPGDEKITFLRVLLNTCQKEFEKLTQPELAEHDYKKEKRLKSRAVGNIKLIGELFNEKLLSERIMHMCIQELLSPNPQSTTPAENVEVLCILFSTAGKKLEESTHSKIKLDAYLARLKVIGESTALPSRIQHMVASVFDLRSKKWVSPQEEMEPKKINEIRAKAKFGQRSETMALRKGRPAATPKLLPVGGGMVPGMSVLPSILGIPGRLEAPVQLVDVCRKAPVNNEASLNVPVASGFVKVTEDGAGREAAKPEPKPDSRVRDHFGVRSNKENYNLRDLLRRVQMF